ncbi:FtsQ-type POTRA domain-containing protein [Caproiciproducens sp. NJN-50]|uniref:cell division protein FtsQ/DivIB n=1 Tax=Caproiciproducens sp. NJN-50 TaxID=2507162 RepID=UPI000FFE2336|nr:FtsQ-type POTRA domain-containing protein [Caproiciproducens sp. NJN-50]QAT50141.1 FtsQ-type POTRA domain-containing protein [Caproiciproducens sp. NJN-50]
MRDLKNGRRELNADSRWSGTNRPARRGNDGAPSRAGIRAENRRRRRRRALLIFYFFLFFTVVSAAVAVSLTVLFKIDTIQVGGTSRYTQEQIIGACGIKKGENLFLAKTRQSEKQIQARLPYIGSVKVRRKFPARISIQVAEAQVCGAVESSGKYVVLGDDFRVLEMADKLPQSCVLIRGITLKSPKEGKTAEFADKSLQSSLTEVERALKSNGLKNITGVDFSSTSKILLTYEGRVTINLGMPSDLDYKISFAKKLFDDGEIKSTEKGTLNLSTAGDNDTAYFDPASGS